MLVGMPTKENFEIDVICAGLAAGRQLPVSRVVTTVPQRRRLLSWNHVFLVQTIYWFTQSCFIIRLFKRAYNWSVHEPDMRVTININTTTLKLSTPPPPLVSVLLRFNTYYNGQDQVGRNNRRLVRIYTGSGRLAVLVSVIHRRMSKHTARSNHYDSNHIHYQYDSAEQILYIITDNYLIQNRPPEYNGS